MCRKCGISITAFLINSTVISLPSPKLLQTYTGKRVRRISFTLLQTNLYPEHRLAQSRVKKVSQKRIFEVGNKKKALLCTGPDLTGDQPQQRDPRAEETVAGVVWGKVVHLLWESCRAQTACVHQGSGQGEGSPHTSPPVSPSCSRYMCSSIMQRAMVAPAVWIVVALLDGKCLICAFSSSVDPEKFPGFTNATIEQAQELLAKVPCKEDELVGNSMSRRAVSRYLRCWSQVGRCQHSPISLKCSGQVSADPTLLWFSIASPWSCCLVPPNVAVLRDDLRVTQIRERKEGKDFLVN